MKKLLIVDDDLDILTLFGEFFEGMGYEVHTAEDGLQGAEVLKQVSLDLVITDLDMPNLNGCELISEISQDFPHIPIIVTSGLNLAINPKYREAMLFTQVKDLFPKPINMAKLYNSVEMYINRGVEGKVALL
ncbi:MAG: response regulator [Candidatus Cloacimonetes bacterium]|nr:response regulator [Candidatus Cloacimonadota bacterium]